MSYIERELLYNASNAGIRIKVALCDWMNYWAINGTSAITDETLRAKTENFIHMGIENPQLYADRISVILMGDPTFAAASEITDQMIQNGVSSVMTNAMDYII